MSKFEELMDDKEFVKGLEKTDSFDGVKKAFLEKGVDLQAELAMSSEDAELCEEELDFVAGGTSVNSLENVLKRSVSMVADGGATGGWKFSASSGILMRAYYDMVHYGDAAKSCSEGEIMSAAKHLGI